MSNAEYDKGKSVKDANDKEEEEEEGNTQGQKQQLRLIRRCSPTPSWFVASGITLSPPVSTSSPASPTCTVPIILCMCTSHITTSDMTVDAVQTVQARLSP